MPKNAVRWLIHEAGHAVIGLNLPYSEKVQKITIIPRGRTGGHVL
jgi:cell division protease FtsH